MTLDHLLRNTNLGSGVDRREHSKLLELRDKAYAQFNKGDFQGAVKTFIEVGTLKSIQKDKNLEIEVNVYSGMLLLALGEPDNLLQITQAVLVAVQNKQMNEPPWLQDIMYVAACAGVIYAEKYNDNNGNIFARGCIVRLNSRCESVLDYDLDSLVLGVEVTYKLKDFNLHRSYIEIMNTLMKGPQLKEAQDYLKLKNVPFK